MRIGALRVCLPARSEGCVCTRKFTSSTATMGAVSQDFIVWLRRRTGKFTLANSSGRGNQPCKTAFFLARPSTDVLKHLERYLVHLVLLASLLCVPGSAQKCTGKCSKVYREVLKNVPGSALGSVSKRGKGAKASCAESVPGIPLLIRRRYKLYREVLLGELPGWKAPDVLTLDQEVRPFGWWRDPEARRARLGTHLRPEYL